MKLSTIAFHDDTLFAVERPDGVFVAVKPICDALGIDPKKQRERIQRDPLLSEGGATMALPSAGGQQSTFCLRLDLVNGWLFTIDAGRVREEARPRVLAYQRECFAVLFAHFYAPRGEGHPRDTDPLPAHPARQEPVPVKRQLVTEARHLFGHRAAGELWLSLDLPVTPSMKAPPGQTDFGFTYTAFPTPPAERPA